MSYAGAASTRIATVLKRLLGVAIVGLFVGLPASARAQQLFHPDLVAGVEELESAKGANAYTALRKIWGAYYVANPRHVEEALESAAQDRRLDPSVRVYAGLLVAYARSRRGDLEESKRRLASLGFVDRWMVVGPFDNEGKSGFALRFGPEDELAKALVPGRAYSGKERPVRWRTISDQIFPYGWIDLGALLRPQQNICGYVATFVSTPKGKRPPREISLWAGAAGAFRIYWNGDPVLEDKAYRGHDVERFAAKVRVESGVNSLVAKLCGERHAPLFSVRLANPRGEPLAPGTLKLQNTFEASTEAAKTVEAVAKRKGKAAPDRLLGAIERFEKLTAGDKPKATDQFAYSEYLSLTASDDPTEHTARNLAVKAVEAEPTIERLLHAAELAEDRNKRSVYVEKAAKLVPEAKPNIDVLLAQAHLAQESQNWREAFPFYDKALALEPDNVAALQGRVELYNEAGLRRTALSTLKRAVERNPQSVALLNMYASQLRTLGRSTEAAEVEARYSARRFDDRTYISSMIDLAIARRENASAEHWVERLLRTDPDSQWAHGVAARTYRRLGQPQRAVALLKRALELAPEDVGTMRELADLRGELGETDKQLALLRKVLELRPQAKDVREYVEHIEPPKPRTDEAYAWKSDRFLKLRHRPAKGFNRRTLVDVRVSTVFDNGLSSQFRQVVFQPLTDAAAAMARQFAFHYQADRQRVQLRAAKVYRGDGSVDEAIESGEAAADNPSIAMYTSGRNYIVQFPRLEPGDVVELRYRIDDVTPRNEFADYFGTIEYFENSEPVAHSEFVLITPKKRKMKVDVVRLPKLKRSVKEKGTQRIYRFSAKDLAPVLPEPAMPPWPEVLGFVHVSTYADYKAMGKWYWGLAKDQFDLDAETRKLVKDLTKNAKTDREKVAAVYGWVVNNTRYVALEFGIYGFKPRRCVQTVARGWGDCKDKATVIVSMLRELGIDATIVIVRTQMRGNFKSKVASLAPFDHAIAYVPSMDLYLDGTAEYTGSSELPTMDYGALALLVNEGDSKLVTLPQVDPKKSVRKRTVKATLAANGKADLEISYDVRGAGAPSWRRRYHAQDVRKERVGQDLGREFPGAELLPGPAGIKTNDLEDIEQPVQLTLKAKVPSFARNEGGNLSMPATLNRRLTSSFASLSKRKLDIAVPALGTTEDRYEITLPPGMKVVSNPTTASGESPFGSYSVRFSQQGNKVVVESKLSISVNRVTPSRYSAWKKFCSDVDRALSPRLVVGR